MTAPYPPSPAASRRPSFLQISLATQLLILIVLVTLISAVAVHTYVRQQQLTDTQNQLDSHAKVLSDRLSDYETLLLSTHSFLYADKQPGTEISTFVSGLHLEQYFPSVYELNVMRFGGGQLATAPAELGPVVVEPAVGQMIQQAINSAARSGKIVTTSPFAAEYRAPLSQNRRSLLIIKPCAVSSSTGQAPCVLYALINIEQLLGEIAQLSPVPGNQVQILIDGQPLLEGTPRRQPPEAPGAGAAAELSASQPSAAARPLSLLAGAVTRQTGAGGDLLQTTVPRLGHDWTLQIRVPQLAVSDPSSLLAPLVVMMGLLAGLLTHRLVSDQLRLNRRLRQVNLDLGASQNFLEQSRADFLAIFQAMDGGAAFTTPDGFVRMMNRRYLDLLGLEFRDLAGVHIDQVRERTVVDEPGNRRELFSAESPEEYSGVVRRLNGAGSQTFWGEMSRIRVTGQGQELLGYLHVLRDVSRALESQQRLRDQEQQSRAALDGVPHVLWMSDSRGRLTYTNEQFRGLLSGPVVRDQIHPEDRAAYDALWKAAYASGQQQETDLRMALRTPEALFLHGQEPTAPAPGWRWVSLKVAPLHTISGEVNEWIAVATDVHARMLAEQLALAEQDHYRMVLSGMPQLVWTVDAEWNVTYVNGRWYDQQPGLPAPVDLDG
ncbi:MAG: PAS domain-containing protein, partial [Deinococcus sp.]|nr:PAS domain-containing protein [Deinococcus sp.]